MTFNLWVLVSPSHKWDNNNVPLSTVGRSDRENVPESTLYYKFTQTFIKQHNH